MPGRLEIVSNNPITIIDGAHNIDAIRETVKYVQSIKNNKKLITIFYCLNNKSYIDMINELDKITDLYLFYEFEDERKSNIDLFISSTNKEYKK